MAMSRVRGLPYVSSGYPLSGDGFGTEEAKLSEARQPAGNETHGAGLHAHMARQRGNWNSIPPVHVDNGVNIDDQYGEPRSQPGSIRNAQFALGNGGHRVAVANDLGWKRIGISSDISHRRGLERRGHRQPAVLVHGNLVRATWRTRRCPPPSSPPRTAPARPPSARRRCPVSRKPCAA